MTMRLVGGRFEWLCGLPCGKGGEVVRVVCGVGMSWRLQWNFVGHAVGGGGEDVKRVYYCPEVRAYAEGHKVAGSVMLDTA